MSNITPEQIEALVSVLKSNGGNSSIVFFWGIIALACILTLVWWVISLRMQPLDQLSGRIDKLTEALDEMSKNMWSSESLDNKITVRCHDCIADHENSCPARKTTVVKP